MTTHDDVPRVVTCQQCGGPAYVCGLPDSTCRFVHVAREWMAEQCAGENGEDTNRVARIEGDCSPCRRALATLLRKTEDGAVDRLSAARTRKNEQLRALLKKHEWSGEVRVDYDDGAPCCPECSGIKPDDYHVKEDRTDGRRVGHADDCALGLLLGTVVPEDEPSRSA